MHLTFGEKLFTVKLEQVFFSEVQISSTIVWLDILYLPAPSSETRNVRNKSLMPL